MIQRNVDTAAGDQPSREQLSALHEPHLQALAQRVEFDYVRLARLSSLSEAMRETRFAQRRPVATDFDWIPALIALLVLVWRFVPMFGRSSGCVCDSCKENTNCRELLPTSSVSTPMRSVTLICTRMPDLERERATKPYAAPGDGWAPTTQPRGRPS